jgi:hypothetical protein
MTILVHITTTTTIIFRGVRIAVAYIVDRMVPLVELLSRLQTTATRTTDTTTTTTTPNITCMHTGLHLPLLAAVGTYQCDINVIGPKLWI